jgi:hypothetical protein
MDFLNSWIGGRSASSPPQSGQQSSVEKRLLEDDPPQPREPISKVFTSATSTTSPQSHFELQSQPAPRQNKAPVVFIAGVAFTALSILITRRSLARRRLTTKPSFYTNTPAHAQAQPAKEVSAPLEAFEALSIATTNVLSLAMLTTGGSLWYFDIASMEDARRKLRGGLGVDGSGRSEGEAEEDFEEWLATALSRKEAKERKREYEGEKEERRVNERGRER